MRNFYKLCLFCCCSVFLVLSNNFTLVASHAKGADMTYKCISSGEYEITLVFYYDCSSTELPPTNVPLEFTSFTCNEYYTDFLFKIFAESEQEVSPLCPESLSQSQCSLGSLPGVKKHVYRRSFSLPQSCPDWIVSFTECCRNPQITNIPNPTDFQLHTEVWIDNSGNICNNSVQFENEPVSYYCNVPSSFEQFAIDPDGDSLVFNLMAPLNYISNPIPFAGAFNLLQPFNAQPFSFNTTNGALTFTPNGQQVAAVAVRVDEYRNGKWVGAVMRDMQLTVANCNNRQLQLTADVPETISVCVGEPVQINLTATDPDSADIPTLTYNEVQFDNASLTINSNAGGLLTAAFLWYPSPADTGIHKLVFRATDNACPFMSEDLFICNIFVNWQPFAGPDLFYCGSPLNVQVSGGGTFTWQPTTGLTLLNETGSSVSLAPTVTTTYTLSNNCSSTDQLTVQVLPDIPLSMPQNEEGCAGQPIQLLPNLPNAAAYSFQWLPAQGLNNPNILTPEASPSDTVVYFLTATDNATGCSVTDSVQVNIPGRLYGLDIASDDTLCSAALNQLNAVLYQRLEGGINTGGFVAQNAMLTVGHDTLSVTSPTPYNGSFENGRIQMLFRKDELLAEGIFPGTISQIGFYVTRKYSPIPYYGFTVKMGHTTDMVIGGFVSGLTTVAQASDYTTQPGWNMHPLDFPYDWDGNRNMLVEICFSNPDWFYRDDVAASETNGNTVVYEEKNGIPVCDISSGLTSDVRPNLRFAMNTTLTNLPDITVQWTPATGLSDPTILNPVLTINQDTAITYTVTVTDGNCTLSASRTVYILNNGNISLPSVIEACLNDTLVLQVSGIDFPNTATYQWSPATGLSCTDCPAPQLIVSNQIYQVTVTDQNGCVATLQTQLQPLPLPQVDAGPTQVVLQAQEVQLNASGTYNAIQWLPAALLNDATLSDPLAAIAQTTTLYAIATAQNGCIATDEVTIVLKDCSELLMPTAFTPNDDGINDRLRIPEQGITTINKWEIYNRWGNLVFSTNNAAAYWNGYQSFDTAPMGLYAVVIEYICNQQTYIYKGNVMLIR